MSARAISDLERGVKRTPRRDTVQLLLDALHLSGEARAAFVASAREPAARPSSKPADDRAIAGGAVSMQALPLGGFLGAVAERPLVGRAAETAAILAAVDVTREGAGRLLVLAGEPGVGKTRLAQEAARACRDRGFVVATGRCYEPHQAVPYYPFLEALSALYAAAPAPVRAEAGVRWPALPRLLPDQPSGALPATAMGASPQEEQQRLFWAVTGFVQAIADIVPVALLLDDLHWADDASLALLLHLARHTRADRILLLGTYRDVAVGRHHPVQRALRDLEREHLVERLPVRRLGHEGTACLIAGRLGQDVSDDCAALARLVYRHTDGHPLFVQEVLRALIERGDLYRRDGRWEHREIAALEVPESVRATIMDRAARLGERAQEALRAASVLGQAFDFETLQALGGQAEDELEAALEEAVAAGLLDESRDGHDFYVFNHALTQQSLYMELPKRHRRRLHLAAAEALERLPEPIRRRQAAELAQHFQEGGAPTRALSYALLAGDQAAAMYAPTEAEQQYQRAVELARELDDQDGEARSLEKLGWLLWMMARFDACAEALERVARLYRGVGDVEGEVRVAALLGMLHFTSMPLEGAARIQALLGRLGAPAPSRPLASLYSSLAMNLLIAGRYGEALEAVTSAGATARALGDERPLAVETMRAPALGLSGRVADARRLLAEWIQEAEAADDYFGLLSAVHYLGDLSVPAGDFDAAWDYYSRALALAERLGARSRLGAETSNLAEVLFYRGDWEQARCYAERAVELARAAAAGRTAPYFQDANVLRRLGVIRAAMGDEEAIRCLEEAVALAERIPYPEAVRGGQAALAEQELLQGRPQAALARLLPLVERADPAELGIVSLLPLLARAHLELGNAPRAEAVAREGIARATRQGHKLALAELLRVHGMALARQGCWAEAERAFEQAVAVARALPFPHAEGRTLYEWGLLSVDYRAPRQARARLEEAAEIFGRLGARPYAERARQALAELAHRRHVGVADAGR